MKWRWVFVGAFLVLGLLAACMEGEEVVVSTAVPTPPPTLEPTATETAVSVSVVEETAVITVTPSPFPTASLTSTATSDWSLPALEPLTEVPLLDGETAYVLTTPAPEKLLDGMRQTANAEDLSFQARLNTDRPHAYTTDYSDVYDLIKVDLDRFYAANLPNATSALTDFSLRPTTFGWWSPSPAHLRLIEDGIVQYLNQNKLHLTAGQKIETENFIVRAFPLDAPDGDGTPDWVLQLNTRLFQTTTHLLLREIAPAHYVLFSDKLPSFVGRYHSDGFTDIYTDHDLTGDGVKEIVIYNDAYLGGNSNDNTLTVYSWLENEPFALQTIDLSYYSRLESLPSFEIRDFDDDGIDDIQVTRQLEGNFECDLTIVTLHTWQGTVFEEEITSITENAACYLWRAIAFPRETPEKIDLLESALIQSESMSPPPFDLIALTRLHLALAQFANGELGAAQATLSTLSDLPTAQATLSTLSDLPTDAPLAQLIYDAYLRAEKDPMQTCRNVLYNADQTLNTGIGSFLTNYEATRGHFLMRYGELPHLPTICDVQETAVDILNNSTLPANEAPNDLLAELGVKLAFATAVNLDKDEDLEWVGILEPQIGKVTTFDAQNGFWTYEIAHLTIAATNFEVAQMDVTGDGVEDVIALATEESFCFDLDKVGIQQSVELLYTTDESARFNGTKLPCNTAELLTIENVGLDNFSSTPFPVTIVWQTLEEYPATELALHQYVRKLQTAVLNQTDPTIPEKITQLLNYLPTNDPEAQPYIEHLTYLLGYFYELSGDEENAVSTYVDLIQQAPTSPWSWLAWARLEPVEN